MINNRVKAIVERELTREDFNNAPAGSRLEKLYFMYEEEGDEALRGTIREEIPADVVHRLTSKRMRELIDLLARSKGESITSIASALGRSVPNVYRDLKLLEKFRLVRFEERGRERIPALTLKRLILSFG